MAKAAKRYKYKGELYTITQLTEIARNGITAQALRGRLNYGMSVEEAITKPPRGKGSRPLMRCGATNWHDCLSCKYAMCIALSDPAMPGENAGEYVFRDYN